MSLILSDSTTRDERRNKYLFFTFIFSGLLLTQLANCNEFRSSAFFNKKKPELITIMLSPASGRKTPDGAERGIARLCAEQIEQQLKQFIAQESIAARVIFSHNVGEQISQQEKSNFANRLNVDLYISILFCTDKHNNLTLSLYRYDNNTPNKSNKKLSFCKQSCAHTQHQNLTHKYSSQLHKNLLDKDVLKKISVRDPIAAQVNCLYGIKPPAIAFEGTLKKSGDWKYYIEPIAQALQKTILSIMEQN